ncbi:YfbU family protein [Novosphingobium sp.]|uniref:YfbU family protein n=1 Tax=Novosphingobium sp. TaxID=1874826 RepID=UPI00286A08F6|nr:YfbU family protein [Novosphingobium sp.]
MSTERFEMRIDSDLIDRLDQWRTAEDDTPSRAEAVRRLIEAGLAHDNKGRIPTFSDGEKLIAMMLVNMMKDLKIQSADQYALVEKAISGGHFWALGWEMPGIFHGHADKQSRVRFVVDVLDMWAFIEEAHEHLNDVDKIKLAEAANPYGERIKFPGFDGNNETEHLGISRFLIHDMARFSRFRTRDWDLNSHNPTIEVYGRMLRAFEPIRSTLIGRSMSVDELARVMAARNSATQPSPPTPAPPP